MTDGTAGRMSLGAVRQAYPDGARLHAIAQNGTITVTFLADDLVRIRVLRQAQDEPDVSWAVVDRAWPVVEIALDECGPEISAHRGAVTVSIRKSDAAITVVSSTGTLLSDARFGWEGGKPVLTWSQPGDRRYYGCGEKAGPLERRGVPMTFWNAELCGYPPGFDPLYQSIPFTLAMDGANAHGMFVDNTFRQTWELGEPGETGARVTADGGALDVYLFPSGEPKTVLTRWTDVVGRCPLPPLWALGYHQSRWSYYPESVVRSLAAEFRQRRIPCDVIWFDIDYMDGFKDFTWHPQRFPDPATLLSDLRAVGFHSVVMLDPGVKVQAGYGVYETLLASGRYVRNADGTPFIGSVWPGPCLFPDFTDPLCRRWWGNQFPAMLDQGIAGFWNDMNEPAVFDSETHTMPLDVVFDGDGHPDLHPRYHNVYGLAMARSTYEALRRYRPDERAFVLTRAGFAGGHRYAATWTGDNCADWPSLALSLPMVMNLGLSGQAISGPDIGGFMGDASPELYARWLQVGALFPFCRCHHAASAQEGAFDQKGAASQEPWSHGADWEEINRESIELRYRLLPYLYTVTEGMTRTGVPVMRPLFLEFPGDPRCATLDDQFMAGGDLLCAPVLTEGARTRAVYLPAGDWYDFYTNERIHGPVEMTVDAPLDRMPLYVRAGAAIPTQAVVQHTAEAESQPIIWRAYMGDGAEGDVYEDDGHSMSFVDGAHVRTHLKVSVVNGTPVAEYSTEGAYPSPRPDSRLEIIG